MHIPARIGENKISVRMVEVRDQPSDAGEPEQDIAETACSNWRQDLEGSFLASTDIPDEASVVVSKKRSVGGHYRLIRSKTFAAC